MGPSGPCNDYSTLYVGEAPGINENNQQQVFVGKTGQEMDRHYMPLAGQRRENSRVINAISCLPDTSGHKLDSKDKRHIALLESCAQTNLYPEIRQSQPTLIVAMGAFANKALDPNIVLDLHHGIPIATDWGTVFPMFHPAGGIHEPKKMLTIRNDWIRLRKYFQGTLEIYDDAYPDPDYAEATGEDIESIDPALDMACDTEYSRSVGPFCLTYSQCPGTARLIRADRHDLLSAFQSKLSRWKGLIYFHNWLYDWKVVEEIGLEFPINRMRDTMVMSFHLGNMPQGLKPLAYRELGMIMMDYEDLVLPYSKPHVFDYYRAAYGEVWPTPEPYLNQDENTGKWKMKKPNNFKSKLKRFFTDFAKDPENKDVFKMWTENWIEHQSMMEERLGPWPGSDIAHVPFDEALYYACRDADAGLRLKTVLRNMRSKVRKLSQDKWRTA